MTPPNQPEDRDGPKNTRSKIEMDAGGAWFHRCVEGLTNESEVRGPEGGPYRCLCKEMTDALTAFPESECFCLRCQSMCFIPCWPTPEEARKLLAAGYGKQLMLNYYHHPKESKILWVLSPAKKGRQRKLNTEGEGRCVFQDSRGLCHLHHQGKPLEGRLASTHGGPDSEELREAIALLWDNQSAQQLAFDWTAKFANREARSQVLALESGRKQ
jgi:hypothetical protein